MVMSLLESLYKSLYKNVKDPALSIFRSPWRPEKSCVFAATVLDPSDTQRQTRTGRPFSCLYRTRPAAFCPYPGGLNFGQIGSASPTTLRSQSVTLLSVSQSVLSTMKGVTRSAGPGSVQ